MPSERSRESSKFLRNLFVSLMPMEDASRFRANHRVGRHLGFRFLPVENEEWLAPAGPVADRPRKQLDERRCRFSHSLGAGGRVSSTRCRTTSGT
jgi:hypothetical protein